MLFHKIGIISTINYFCELVTVMLNEGLLSLKEKTLVIINFFVAVTKKRTLPDIRLLTLSLYLD
jgi:hypothetical protein